MNKTEIVNDLAERLSPLRRNVIVFCKPGKH